MLQRTVFTRKKNPSQVLCLCISWMRPWCPLQRLCTQIGTGQVMPLFGDEVIRQIMFDCYLTSPVTSCCFAFLSLCLCDNLGCCILNAKARNKNFIPLSKEEGNKNLKFEYLQNPQESEEKQLIRIRIETFKVTIQIKIIQDRPASSLIQKIFVESLEDWDR